MKKIGIGILLVLMVLPAFAQKEGRLSYYWVTFTDKAQSIYEVETPEAFLGPRALERRVRYEIPVTEEDFPVNSWYLDSLSQLGAKIHHTSRWFNAATVRILPEAADTLKSLPFVEEITYVGPVLAKVTKKGGERLMVDSTGYEGVPDQPYGYSTLQMSILQGFSLHQRGFTGKGKIIGVLDGGFDNVDVMPFFDSLRQHNAILATRDFVEGDSMAYESSTHGTKVLSTMAANLPNLLVGTAPGAQYILMKTEDTGGEFRIEECNWIAAVEFADSSGVDIINSSLGYTTFNDSTMNYEFESLDGATGMASQAADLAFARGMILVNSAGNEGNSKWKHIGVPADSKGVFAIGATTFKGKKASFSSFGPSADGRVKPDVSGPGQFVPVASVDSYQVMIGSGTSFAAPIITGLVASLWEAFPEASNQEILAAIKQSASQYEEPDDKLGYGIPDFAGAYDLLAALAKEKATESEEQK